MSKVWTEEELKKASDSLEGKAPEEAIRWAVENFETKDLSLACSFGAEDVALVDMVVKIKPDARIFYLDTDLLFKESHEVKERLIQRYGIKLDRYGAKTTLEQMAGEFGPELWKREPDKCCNIRKMVPLAEALSGLRCWITGIRRDQAPTRANAPVVELGREVRPREGQPARQDGPPRTSGTTSTRTTSPTARSMTRTTPLSAASPAPGQ